jgi:hypothetical protein
MDMLEVEGIDMVEEQDHPTNHRLREEGINMVGSNMVEVDGMDTLEEYFHPMNHRPEVEGMDTVEEHFHPINHRSEVGGVWIRWILVRGRIERVSWRWLKNSPRA